MSRHPVPPLFRAIALLGVGCVLALTVLAASPQLHAALHATIDAGHTDCPAHRGDIPVGDAAHDCVVTLFAGGVTPLLAFCLLALAGPLVRGVSLLASDEIAAAFPRYRLVPSHAPPAA